MEIPTKQQIWNEEGFVEMHHHSDASWRHGTRETVVYKRESDETFWQAKFRLSTDGEVNGLRDEDESCDIVQVYPHWKTVTVYTTEP